MTQQKQLIVYTFKSEEARKAYSDFASELWKRGYSPKAQKTVDDSLCYSNSFLCIELYDDCRWYVFNHGAGTDPRNCRACGINLDQFRDWIRR